MLSSSKGGRCHNGEYPPGRMWASITIPCTSATTKATGGGRVCFLRTEESAQRHTMETLNYLTSKLNGQGWAPPQPIIFVDRKQGTRA